MKFWLYHLFLSIQRFFWRTKGFRRITAFGVNLKISGNTVFPSYRKHKLPVGGHLSDIVRYADFVQFHAICNRIDKMTKPPVILEVGAHHGAYAVTLGKLVEAKGGRVVALEPNPESYRILSENISLNGLENCVTPLNLAAMEKAGQIKITLEGGQSSIKDCSNNSVGVTVSGKPLSEIIKIENLSYISLMIVDVEGAELPVLKSFPWDSVPVETILCELHPYAWPQFSYDGKEMSEFLKSRKYRCMDMYLQEYDSFEENRYIGPCLFMQDKN